VIKTTSSAHDWQSCALLFVVSPLSWLLRPKGAAPISARRFDHQNRQRDDRAQRDR
jgi:hypothetical protein